MGTLLLPALRLAPGRLQCTDTLNMSSPDAVVNAHLAYLEAGARWLTTNTFCSEPLSLKNSGFAPETVAKTGAELAFEARARFSHDQVQVMGSMGPGWRSPEKQEVEISELYDIYRIWANGLLEGGVDGICLETVTDLTQAETAYRAVKSLSTDCEIYVFLHVGPHLDAAQLTQHIERVVQLQPAGVGLNCSQLPSALKTAVAHLQTFSGLRLLKPNAGVPGHYVSPAAFAQQMAPYAEYIDAWGGCCGTSPEHIHALYDLLN